MLHMHVCFFTLLVKVPFTKNYTQVDLSQRDVQKERGTTVATAASSSVTWDAHCQGGQSNPTTSPQLHMCTRRSSDQSVALSFSL